MYKLIIALLLLSSAVPSTIANAQDKKSLDSVDKVIINQIIIPAEQKAGNEAPQWTALGMQIKASYSDLQADRALTRAKIYYYYGKDWPQFSAALVHYTETYEDKEDLPLMNKNANFILQRSTNPDEWKTALAWVKHAVDKEPSNTAYQQTYQGLLAKTTMK